MKDLLEAGVHFGHQTGRWNPRMRRYIFGERGGIHVIDLQSTERLLGEAERYAAELAGRGGTILFVGTKKQARDAVKEAAERSGMPYVNQRWLGGLLTNYQTISKRIKRLHELTDWTENGTLDLLPTRERIAAMAERDKLETNLGGVRDMQRVPDAVFITDLKTEEIALREADRLGLPIIALVDTNCDPQPVTYPIPGNDDAIRSCKIIIDAIGDVVADRAAQFRLEEERARREAEEQARREAEEQARRHAEEEARREAEEEARRAAEEQAGRAAEEQAGREPAQVAPEGAAQPGAGQPEGAPASRPAEAQREAAEATEEPRGGSPRERDDHRRRRQGAPRPNRRGHDGLQGRAPGGRGRRRPAVEMLRVKGQAQAAKRGGRVASEGVVGVVHPRDRQDRRPRRGRLRDGLRRPQRRLPCVRPRRRAARRRGGARLRVRGRRAGG